MPKPIETACRGDVFGVGDVIAGKYVIRALLGQGGMGTVVEAEHLELQERVAIKLLTLDVDRVPAARARFMREAKITARLRGENTTRVTDYGLLEDGTPFMVMEYLDGIDLRELLHKELSLPVGVAIRYAVQACAGLAEAHALGIVHRDLKPSNLFVTTRPDGSDLIKVVDFGVSKSFSLPGTEDDITATGAILGSPRYMAPEQLESSGRADSRADVWSLGVVLYEMLAGHPPFVAESAAALCHQILRDEIPSPLAGRVPNVTPELEAVVLRCLRRDLNERMPDVGTLAQELAKASGLEGLPAAAASITGILERMVPPSQVNPPVVRHSSAKRNGDSRSSSKTRSKIIQRKRPRTVVLSLALAGIAGAVVLAWAALRPDRLESSSPVSNPVTPASRSDTAPPDGSFAMGSSVDNAVDAGSPPSGASSVDRSPGGDAPRARPPRPEPRVVPTSKPSVKGSERAPVSAPAPDPFDDRF
jgi:serine/threonine-protein kinase